MYFLLLCYVFLCQLKYFCCYVRSVLFILFHCVALCTVCVYMCTVLLPPGVTQTAVKYRVRPKTLSF
jgi:hypothetical protein